MAERHDPDKRNVDAIEEDGWTVRYNGRHKVWTAMRQDPPRMVEAPTSFELLQRTLEADKGLGPAR